MNRQSEPTKINWRQALAEVLLLLAGIGLALAADDWFQQRQDREEENQYLVSLLDDFNDTKERIEEALMQTARRRDRSIAFIQALKGQMDSLSDEDLLSFIQDAFFYFGPTAVLATYHDMVNSGDLRLIQDETLRRRLAQFDSDWTDYQRVLDEAFGQWNLMQAPYLVEHTNVSAIYLQEYRGVPLIEGGIIHRDGLWTRDFENLLGMAIISRQDMILEGEKLLADVEEIIHLIDADQ